MITGDNSYFGQVDKDGIEQGIGRQISKSNGEVYEGEWKNGYYNGYGRLIGGEASNVDYFMGQW